MTYHNYFFSLEYWKKGLRSPTQSIDNVFVVLRYQYLYKNVCRKVEGLIDHYLGVLLYNNVLKCKSSSPNVVEAGAYKGLSTVYLALAAAKKGKRVKSFELFTGLQTVDPNLDDAFKIGDYKSDVEEYRANIKKCNVEKIVDLTVGDATKTMLPAIKDKGFALAFLDVDVYEVMRDLLFQLWGVAKGNEIIIIHDINRKGVRKAVDEFHQLSKNKAKEKRSHGNTVCKLVFPERI
jgi:predicted O-methyltransferase YrrM